MNDHEVHTASWKLLIAWVGAVVGSVTLSQLLMGTTLFYTIAQMFFLLRDKWWRERK